MERTSPFRVRPPIRFAAVRTYRVIDLFAGCGGMTRGFDDTGRSEPVFAVEFDRDAAETYEANFGDHVARAGPIEDVADVPGRRRRDRRPALPGLLAPQPRGVGLRTPRPLARYLRALEETAPQAFVMENVPELLRSRRVRRVPATARRGARLRRRGPDPERRRLRRPAAPPPRDRDRHAPATPPWPTDALRPTQAAGRPSLAHFPRRRRGPAARAGRPRLARPRNPRPESIRRYKAVPRTAATASRCSATSTGRASATSCRAAGGTSRPAPPTSSVGCGGTAPRSRSAPSSTSPRRAAISTRPHTGRSRCARRRGCMSFADDFVLPERPVDDLGRPQIGNAVPPLLAQRIADALRTTSTN